MAVSVDAKVGAKVDADLKLLQSALVQATTLIQAGLPASASAGVYLNVSAGVDVDVSVSAKHRGPHAKPFSAPTNLTLPSVAGCDATCVEVKVVALVSGLIPTLQAVLNVSGSGTLSCVFSIGSR